MKKLISLVLLVCILASMMVVPMTANAADEACKWNIYVVPAKGQLCIRPEST